jgi:hypothetical protein
VLTTFEASVNPLPDDKRAIPDGPDFPTRIAAAVEHPLTESVRRHIRPVRGKVIMDRRAFVALLAAATVLVGASPAAAQRYYVRETIAGLKAASAQQYTGTWTHGAWDTNGACISGKRIERRVATCQATSGNTANPTCEGPKPADITRQVDCQTPLRCQAPTNAWVGGGHTSYQIIGTADTEAGMISLCSSRPQNGAGLCTWQGPGNNVGYAFGANTYASGISNQPTWRIARCDP